MLDPLLGVGDIRTDKRIDFVGGARGTPSSSGWCVAAARPWPSHASGDVDDLMAIPDAGGIMPPKSTWFEPKLRDGLLVHLI